MPRLPESIALCRLLQDSGAAAIAVHGRGAGSPTDRRHGAADLEQAGGARGSVEGGGQLQLQL